MLWRPVFTDDTDPNVIDRLCRLALDYYEAWARNPHAQWSIREAMKREPRLQVTLANEAEEGLIDQALE